VQGSRFIFLSRLVPDDSGDSAGEVLTWMLVSPNNRPLGQAAGYFASHHDGRAAVLRLRQHAADVTAVTTGAAPAGHWVWRVALYGVPVAVSTRSYLRQQECTYNMRRFLEALPVAELVAEVRVVRSGR